MITAQTPIVIKSWSALPRKIVVTKKANDVAIPPKGDIFLLCSLFSFILFFFLNFLLNLIKVPLNKTERVKARSNALIIGS
jgi:hypothetical protein